MDLLKVLSSVMSRHPVGSAEEYKVGLISDWFGLFKYYALEWGAGWFPYKKPEARGFDILFVVSANKLLNKQSIRRWLEAPWYSRDILSLLSDGTNASQQEEFLREMAIMKGLGRHPHVVSMIACCTLDTPLCLVVEHMANGDLLHYLRRHRHLIQEVSALCPRYIPLTPETRVCIGSSLVQAIACRLFGAKLLPEPMMTYCQSDP